MQTFRCDHLLTFAASVAITLGMTGLALAHDGHEHGAPLHGGKVAMTKEYHFEVVFAKDGIKVYPRSHEDQPVDASRLTGTATFYHPSSSSKPWFERKLAPTAASPGRAPSSIGTAIDLGKVPASGAKVEFKVEGLPEPAETTAAFIVPFALSSRGELIVTKATKADAKAIAALKTCPVSNEDLDSMGGPLKVTRDGKSTLICCKGCLKELRANPAKYFGNQASSPAAKDEHDLKH
ncbi:hypothetical protein SAMN05444166_6732 [Singulisphaera sp. GP187]|uniref:hypothetical protein n=1 Tax=Singulisphaera sp. GP187 TaxID=1882752 RepID=UPI000926E8AD|nr:hypothetical protein [Singulisphaera sp. GP187]SIO61350.1 hypothetical protein SAMN05444166_6732 [Singulisphaera sp. GP187]